MISHVSINRKTIEISSKNFPEISTGVYKVIADVNVGYFLLFGLEEGTYEVSVEPREEGYSETAIKNVPFEVDETTDIGTVVLD